MDHRSFTCAMMWKSVTFLPEYVEASFKISGLSNKDDAEAEINYLKWEERYVLLSENLIHLSEVSDLENS